MADCKVTFDLIMQKISDTDTISSESREIFKMFVLLLQSIKNDHETTIANFRQEVEASRTEIEETVRASLEPLREEISTALNQRDSRIIEAEKEIASLKDEFKKLKNAADE